MNRRIKNIISVIAIILLVIGVLTSIPAFLERNFTILLIDLVIVIIGVILFASVFDV